MKVRNIRKRVWIVLLVVVSSMFLMGETIYLPLVMGTGAAVEDEVLIPAGRFAMGCLSSSLFHSCPVEESRAHLVDLDDYYIDKYEVTNAQYKVCVAAGDCTVPSNTTAYNDAAKVNHPVVYVDWFKADAYCAWAGGRLPTEAEWEKAARGDGYPRTFPWGDASPTSELANFNSNVGDTTAVGSYPAGVSPYGVHDMAGNVWEWVNDWYQDNYYGVVGAYLNPKGPDSGTTKVLRGGGWGDFDFDLRVARRGGHPPTLSYRILGFRCARSP